MTVYLNFLTENMLFIYFIYEIHAKDTSLHNIKIVRPQKCENNDTRLLQALEFYHGRDIASDK